MDLVALTVLDAFDTELSVFRGQRRPVDPGQRQNGEKSVLLARSSENWKQTRGDAESESTV
jgi:hypothetical protein